MDLPAAVGRIGRYRFVHVILWRSAAARPFIVFHDRPVSEFAIGLQIQARSLVSDIDLKCLATAPVPGVLLQPDYEIAPAGLIKWKSAFPAWRRVLRTIANQNRAAEARAHAFGSWASAAPDNSGGGAFALIARGRQSRARADA
jgi:hypothetical protein